MTDGNAAPGLVPLSLLDRALTPAGVSDAAVLTGVVDRARTAEDLGFHGFWVAEHHAVPGIAGSSPALLAGAVAAATRRIRVGTGGLMVPTHPPFILAEQVSVLSALHPGRLDVGLGASTGFTAAVRRALHQSDDAAAEYDDDVAALVDALGGRSPVTLRPQPAAPAPLLVLTGGSRLPLAARLGLGAVVGGPSVHPPAGAAEGDGRRGPGHPEHTPLARYRQDFRPSPLSERPRVIASVTVAVAPTPEAAQRLALPEVWATALSRSTGSFDPLQPVDALDPDRLTHQQARRVRRQLEMTVHGTPEHVQERLTAIARWTGADELLLTGGVSDPQAGGLSDRLLAGLSIRR